MTPRQREGCVRVVVERGSQPLGCIVALGAVLRICYSLMIRVDRCIVVAQMAKVAFCWGPLVSIGMALLTINSNMLAKQRKSCCAVIKSYV